jgi:hypothetical protein
MDPEHSPEQAGNNRLARLQELAHSLERAYAAVLDSDLAEIRRQTALQQELCSSLRQRPVNPPEMRALSRGRSAAGNGDALAEHLAEVERKVVQLNRKYAALLRRARRTVDIFCRVLATSALTYPPPRPQAASFAASFQE